mmetsp:Transcript_10992/g.36111  ORF Transcript_10992/g.36111 Transcript_10992/m.36111 type:complete len:276 (-) Transcript_10992:60-887(-)
MLSARTIFACRAFPLQETFNSALSPSLWTTITTVRSASDVYIQNRQLKVKSRGYLSSVVDYDSGSIGGVILETVLGTNDATDRIVIFMRSNGIPDPNNNWGDLSDGIVFLLNFETGSCTIYGRGNCVAAWSECSFPVGMNPGTMYRLTTIDYGNDQVSFTVESLDGIDTCTTQSWYNSATYVNARVGMFNREWHTHITSVEEIHLYSVPSPPPPPPPPSPPPPSPPQPRRAPPPMAGLGSDAPVRRIREPPAGSARARATNGTSSARAERFRRMQ